MNTKSTYRTGIAVLMVMLGGLQAWDSNVLSAGWQIILLVSIAILIPAILFLMPSKTTYFVGSILLSFAVLGLARFISPIPLPGLFIVLLPVAMGLLYIGFLEQNVRAA